MTTMKAVQISRPGGDFELVERPIPEPAAGQVRVKVEACGVCHSDVAIKEGIFPWLQYPRIPGHEVVGIIDAVGADVTAWKAGQRVGVGWHGGHCFECEACRDGGYAEYMVAPQEGLALVPEAKASAQAAPLLCAGITCFNALRHSGAGAGDVVAVQGVGGLGHLGLQYAKKFGFKTVAISGGSDKRALAEELGADVYIDAAVENPAEALQQLGGARVVLATAPDGPSMSGLLTGLKRNGTLLVVGIGLEPIAVSTWELIVQRRNVLGWPNGTARDSEETMAFSVLSDIKSMVETFPLEKAAEAYQKMMTNQLRFRAVLEIA